MKKILATLSGFTAALVLAATPLASAATSTVVITGDTSAGENNVGWMFDRDPGSSTPYEFKAGTASTGKGSLYVPPIGTNGSDKFVAEYFYMDEIANVNSVSFDFKTVNPADVQDFYLNLYVNDGADPTEFYDCRYNVVPTTYTPNVSTGFMTVNYDLSAATDVTQRGSSSISCPNNPSTLPLNAVLRSIQLNVGQSNATDVGASGYLDNVVLNEDNGTTAFDFEPTFSPTTKEDCKNGGWSTFSTPTIFKNQGECVSFMAKTKTADYTLNSNNPDGINVPTKTNTWYKVTVSGTWTNRVVSGNTEVVDAECTDKFANLWENKVLGGYSPNLLDVQINEEFVEWGDCDPVNHSYTQWVQGDGNPMNLRVFDGDTNTNEQIIGWFGDNVGTLSVKVEAH